MSWKNILIIFAVIIGIHAVVIMAIVNSNKPEPQKKNVATDNVAEKNSRSAPDKTEEKQDKKTAVKTAEKVKPSQPGMVKPFIFGKTQALPPALQKQAKRARSGILIDLNSRKVLWSKRARHPVAVASLTKLMTALLIAEKMEKDPEFKWTKPVKITAEATNVERSCVLGVKKDELYILGELMQSMMINSHNDSAAQLAAEHSGNVGNFVKLMNFSAHSRGMLSTGFNSPNGLPQGKKRINSFASAEDICHICEELMKYPKIMQLCVMRSARLHTGRRVYSHNNLLLGPTKHRPKRRPVDGLIGFKTGFTNAAGSCLAFGVKRNGRTVIGCVTGFPSAADRDNFCRGVIEWTFRKNK